MLNELLFILVVFKLNNTNMIQNKLHKKIIKISNKVHINFGIFVTLYLR
jgi:hypothetical protein